MSRHRPAWYAVDTQLMLTIYDSLSHAPWVEGRATNSQCPCAAYIIGNCIRREMNWPGGVASGSILSKLRNGCGRKRSPPVRLESSAHHPRDDILFQNDDGSLAIWTIASAALGTVSGV